MGFFGEFKGKYEDIPDEQLNFYQRHIKRWQSNVPFPVSSGFTYGIKAKQGIDGRLTNSLGLADIDDLFEMKAPFLYGAIKNTNDTVYNLYEFVNKSLPENNKLQKIQGKYEQLEKQFQELKKRCISQKKIIESTMEQNRELIEQNKELIKQNQQLQSLLVSAKKASASASFSR